MPTQNKINPPSDWFEKRRAAAKAYSDSEHHKEATEYEGNTTSIAEQFADGEAVGIAIVGYEQKKKDKTTKDAFSKVRDDEALKEKFLELAGVEADLAAEELGI